MTVYASKNLLLTHKTAVSNGFINYLIGSLLNSRIKCNVNKIE